MLKDDIEKYTNLTGEDGWHVPIMKVGAYLDGYNKGLDVLDKIRAEIIAKRDNLDEYDEEEGLMYTAYEEILGIIDKYKAESEDEEYKETSERICDSCKYKGKSATIEMTTITRCHNPNVCIHEDDEKCEFYERGAE